MSEVKIDVANRLGCLLILVVIFVVITVIDGLTHGGLFKNAAWQFVRQIWS